jgi:hypothetical protein
MKVSVKKSRRKKRRRSHYKRGSYASIKGGICKYRSGWELAYLQYLDNLPEVVSFQYEKIVIFYVSNQRTGKLRKYYPDIFIEYVDGRKELVEIKPAKRLDRLVVRKKLAAAELWCSAHGVTLKVITEHHLKPLRLI